MLKFSGVSFSYGDKTILSDFDLSVNGGERVAVLGHSGSGKTTLMKLAAGPDNNGIEIGKTAKSVVFSGGASSSL